MKPRLYNLDFIQGATFQLLLNLQDANTNPLPLANSYSSSMHIKTSYSNAMISESLSTANGEITLGSNAGVYLLTLPANRTGNLYVNLNNNGLYPKTTYVYDYTLTNTSANIVYKILYGTITVHGQL